ncbi:AAA family ATPase [Lentzea sp. NPDC092896]|uniref:helix-turn-helix transcriptional regulator n=1 Tax=Lentzea sp. NPDC092896 TaxID=3364127 RepID=UPI00381FD321
MTSPVLIGRESELDSLRGAYERARGGDPVTVLVTGEAGIGKSRLVSTAVGALPGEPIVLSGGCLELGADGAPYVPFVAVLRDLARKIGRDGVTRLLPSDGTALSDWLPGLGPAPARFGLTRLLEEVLGLLSGIGPAVVVIEDLHWADASSRELFAYLARNLGGSQVLLIGTLRTGELASGHPGRRLFAELGRRADVRRIDVPPLDRRQVADLLAAVDGDSSRAAEVHRRSGGNPLFAEALSTSGEEADLRTLLLDRITALPAGARDLLATLAVAGTALELEDGIGDLAGLDLVVADGDGHRIRHDLIREAVYDSVPPARRRQLHARSAEALAVDSAAVAEHWAAAGEFGRAAAVAWRAAAIAARQYACDEQLHLLELVLAHWSPEIVADRTAVLELAAEAAFAAGRSGVGVEHCTAALAEVTEPQRVARLLGLRGRLRSRMDGTGQDDLRGAIELAPPGPLRSRLLAALAIAGMGSFRHEESRSCATEALAIADELDDDALRAPALLVLAALGNDREMFARARELAARVDDDHTLLTTYQWEADAAERAGQVADAVDLARTGRQVAQRLGRVRSRGSMLAAAQAMCQHWLGQWDEAIEAAEDALADGPPPLYAAFSRLTVTRIALERGDEARFEPLMRQLAEYSRHAHGAAQFLAEFTMLRLTRALGQGELEVAQRVLTDQLDLAVTTWWPEELLRLTVIGTRVQRARRAAAPRDRKLAQDVEQRLAELTEVAHATPATTPVLTAYRLTFDAATLSTWDEAAAKWRELGNPHETAQALVEGAVTALASNNKPGARTRLREAQEIAMRLKARPLLARIGDLVARGGLEDAETPLGNDFGLTRRELDVLAVLVRGRSNSQIAAELFVSVNTVATHVARILAKLGVATRTEAVRRALELGVGTTPR